MIELAADQRAGMVNRFRQIGEARDEAIVEDAERGTMIARIAGDHHCLGDDHRGTTARPLGVVALVALGRETVGGAEVCPHRAHDDAILQPQRAYLARLLQQH
jgi:hypothetical protein